MCSMQTRPISEGPPFVNTPAHQQSIHLPAHHSMHLLTAQPPVTHLSIYPFH